MGKTKLVAIDTLAVGAKCSSPDWPPCATWPELVRGWDMEVLEQGTRVWVRRTLRKEGAQPEVVWVAPSTQVIPQ